MKVILGLVLALALVSPAYALLDDNSTLKDSTNQLQGQIAEGGDASQAQGQGQGQLQGQAQGQGQGQAQGQAAIAAQGQIQGNLGIQRGNDVENEVNIEGDSSEDKTYAVSYPSLSGGEGVSQANAYSIFGGLGVSSTEKYKALITQIQAIEAIQSLTADEKKVIVDALVAKMVDSNKTKRFLGLFWETSGRDLGNLLGLLSFDSFWKEGQKPFQAQKSEEKEIVVSDSLDSVEGNRGYVNR